MTIPLILIQTHLIELSECHSLPPYTQIENVSSHEEKDLGMLVDEKLNKTQ